jgi:hypothetical protein
VNFEAAHKMLRLSSKKVGWARFFNQRARQAGSTKEMLRATQLEIEADAKLSALILDNVSAYSVSE